MYMLRSLVFICILILSACSDTDNDVVEFVQNVKKNSVGTVDKLPPEKEPEIFEYGASEIRSPFDAELNKVVVVDEQQNVTHQQPRPDVNRPREFLEKYPIEEFSMVGTLVKKNFTWGLLQTEDGMVHAVKVGDYLGENSGHITKITDDSIILQQTIPDGKGGWMPNEVSIVLKANRSDKNAKDTPN